METGALGTLMCGYMLLIFENPKKAKVITRGTGILSIEEECWVQETHKECSYNLC